MSQLFKGSTPITTSCLSLLVCVAIHTLSAEEATKLQPSLVADGPPDWLKDHEFKTDSFTFVRLKYDQPPGRWATDYPDAESTFRAD